MNKKLQVFVSSTYTDLKEERQAAVEAILDAGHIPAGMELFKAGNESQLKTIYKWIDESDVYMLILGGRYGSVDDNSGKSYTQLEYEYALSKNIPVFAVVLSQSFLTSKINSMGLEKIMEQNNPDKHKSFKSLVMSKIIREVDDCKDIKIAIHSTLNEFINEYDLIGWIRNYTNENLSMLLNENNSLKVQIQELQKQLNTTNKEPDKELVYSTLITILKKCKFKYYESIEINALDFFLISYVKCLQEYWYSTDDIACPIFFFLEDINIVKKIDHTGANYYYKEIIRFDLTQYGIDFYEYIKNFESQLLQ